MMKNTSKISLLLLAASAILIFLTCEKDLGVEPTDPVVNPTSDSIPIIVEGIRATNGFVFQKGYTEVIIKAKFSHFLASSFTVTNYGHVVSKSISLPDINRNDGKSANGSAAGLGEWASKIENLEPGTTYSARVYVETKDNATGEVKYGYHPKSFSFTTLNPEPPTVIDTIRNVLSNSFLMEGKIVDFKGTDVLNHGFLWSTTHTGDTSLTITHNEGKYEQGAIDRAESHSFSYTVTGLEGGTTYFARAFAQNEYGYGYGNVLQVTTMPDPVPLVVIDSIFLVSDANNTGQPNPGEAVTYNVTLRNIGEATAENVDVNFYSNDATILSSQPATYGSIVPSGKKSRQVQLQISNSVSAGDVIQIATEINGDNLEGTADNSTFVVTIAASPVPEIEIASIALVADGNNSGEPNPGELATYNVTLRNTGDITAENVKAVFSSSELTMITPQPVSFGTIVQNGTKSKQIQFEISNFVSPGDIIQVLTEISGDNFEPTTDNTAFSLTIAAPPAPDISLLSVVVTEPNGTGNVNPGEEVTLTITLKNTGDAAANGLNLSIGTSPHYSILTPLPVDYGTILPNGQKTKEVVIDIGNAVPWNTSISVPIYVADDEGTNWPFSPGATFTVISPYTVSNGLGFYLRFNECNGNSISSVVGNYTGFLYSPDFSSNTIPGISGCSMQFNSSESDYIQFAYNPFQNFTAASFSFWLSTNAANAMLFHGNTNGTSSGFWLEIKNNKFNAPYSVFNFTTPLNSFLSSTEWHHFVLVAGDGGQSKLYIDGQFMEARNYDSINGTTYNGLFLGKASFSNQYSSPPFNGRMDNFRIYNRALTEAEVQQIFNAKQ